MRTFALFVAKTFRIFNIYGVSARIKGEGVETVRTRGRSEFFADVFYGRSLI